MEKKTFSADLELLHQMLTFVQDYCTQKPLDKSNLNQIILALEEALVNIIEHAYNNSLEKGGIEIVCQDINNGRPGIEFLIIDTGSPFDPTDIESLPPTVFDEYSAGGHGIRLYLKIMDKVHYKREQQSNYLSLVKYLEKPNERAVG